MDHLLLHCNLTVGKLGTPFGLFFELQEYFDSCFLQGIRVWGVGPFWERKDRSGRLSQ